MYTQENDNHLRLHLRAIMALDHSRLGLENKFFWNKSSRIFCVRQVYLIKSCLKIWWRVTSLFHFLYITSEVKQHTMRRCFYHTGLGEKALFHNLQDKLHSMRHSVFRTIEARLGRSKNFQNHLVYGQPVLTFDKRQICSVSCGVFA